MNLYIPIKKELPTKSISFYCKKADTKEKVMELLIPVDMYAGDEYHADYYAPLPLENVTPDTLVIEGEAPEAFFKAIQSEKPQADSLSDKKEENRPSIHFTAKTGWINDPNGLVYQDGTYHLYFQYNPFDIAWNNMCWGHAVSQDLLHWKQLKTVLYPDENGTIFSGSGIRNDRGLLGLPKNALLFFYTSAGDTFTQHMAYSLDGGKTLVKFPGSCLENKNCKEDRDPKVFWHETSNAYIMVLWLEETDFGIYRSTDLTSWEQTDRVTLQDACECPDLVEVRFDDGSTRWAFFCADGFYFWGDFDGYHFVTDHKKHCLYFNKNLYAAQTYSGIDGQTIFVPWLRLKNTGSDYTGAMGIPRTMTGVHTAQGDMICCKPVIADEKRREELVSDKDNVTYMEFTRPEDRTEQTSIIIEETEITYNWDNGELAVGQQIYLTTDSAEKLSLIKDGNILEIFINDGVLSGAFLTL